MIDSHCHLDHEPLLSDLTNVIKRSKKVGIKKLLTISTSLESFDRIKTIIQKDKMIYGTIGIHPHETNKNKITSDIIIKNITENDKIIGIGETGLDFFRNISSYEEQLFAFEEQIKIAIDNNQPLFLHQRDAHADFMKVVKKYKDNIPKAVLHCFTGTQKELDDYLNMGFYIGLTGWICDERRNVDLRKSLINIPLEKLMIETDCPYLIPRNLDDKPKNNRNEPSYLPHIAKEIASLVNIDVNKFVEVTYANSINFFK